MEGLRPFRKMKKENTNKKIMACGEIFQNQSMNQERS